MVIGMNMSRSKALLLAMALILVPMFSGCINAHWTKDLINPDKGDFVLEEVSKVRIIYFFNTVVNDPTTWQFHQNNETTIVRDTEWMRIHIEVRIDAIPSDIPIPGGLPIPEPERYVTLTVTMPDGTQWIDIRYNETIDDNFEILYPVHGEWMVTVDAVGYGLDAISYHDYFKVFVDAREPVPRK
jgi:hypothetical protein